MSVVWGEYVAAVILAGPSAFCVGPAPTHAKDQKSAPQCSVAEKKLDDFLEALPHSCKRNLDCDGYYLQANSCAPAVVLAKPGVPKSKNHLLLKLQDEVRSACGAEFSQQPACAPQPFRSECKQNRCVDALRPVTLVTETNAGNSYPFAYIQRQCAPWDALRNWPLSNSGHKTCSPGKEPYLGISIYSLPIKIHHVIVLDGARSSSSCAVPNPVAANARSGARFALRPSAKDRRPRGTMSFVSPMASSSAASSKGIGAKTA